MSYSWGFVGDIITGPGAPGQAGSGTSGPEAGHQSGTAPSEMSEIDSDLVDSGPFAGEELGTAVGTCSTICAEPSMESTTLERTTIVPVRINF